MSAHFHWPFAEINPTPIRRTPFATSEPTEPTNPVIPAEAVEAAADVLVYHQRRDIKGCTCGWSAPGRSYPEHQARLALEAAAPYLRAAIYAEAWLAGSNYQHDPKD